MSEHVTTFKFDGLRVCAANITQETFDAIRARVPEQSEEDILLLSGEAVASYEVYDGKAVLTWVTEATFGTFSAGVRLNVVLTSLIEEQMEDAIIAQIDREIAERAADAAQDRAEMIREDRHA